MDPKQPQDFDSDFSGGPSGGRPSRDEKSEAKQAADLIREKLKGLYDDEPDTKEELTEVKADHGKLSKHQAYMLELSKSGKSFAEIHTAWHDYYQDLPDREKHEVWQEFYAANKNTAEFVPDQYKKTSEPKLNLKPKKGPSETLNRIRRNLPSIISPDLTMPSINIPKPNINLPKPNISLPSISLPKNLPGMPSTPDVSIGEIKKQIVSKVKKPRSKRFKNLKSLIFGLSLGCLAILIFLFSFFNEAIIAPFITPSQNVSAQSIIFNPDSIEAGPNPLLIIPKINVELPVVYNDPDTNPNVIENSLEDGVVHFPTTPYPGQLGNGVIFGHSSNNILNPGQYKFAFVLLHDLKAGDTFYLQYLGQIYVYQVYQTEIVSPSDTSVLDTTSKPATFTLITCDPPGTSINRLVVIGEQISPSPTADSASAVNQNTAPKPAILPSQSPSLWSRFVKAIHL